MVTHPDHSEESNGDLPVALDTLATQDGTLPSEGDQVDVQVSGTISRVDEATNCAYVTPATCNGEPPPHMEKEDAGNKLKRQAQEADDSDEAPPY